MIRCKLEQVREYTVIPEKPKEKLRFGRYLNCIYSLPDYGRKKWLIGANLVLEENLPLTEDNASEIAEKCIAFLNTPPPSKHKRGRKPSKLVYGKFDEKPFRVTLRKTDDGKEYLQVLLVTNQRKNRSFWGEGPKVEYKKRKKRS